MGVFTWVSAVSFQCPIESPENLNSLVNYLFFQFFFREKKFNKQKKKKNFFCVWLHVEQ